MSLQKKLKDARQKVQVDHAESKIKKLLQEVGFNKTVVGLHNATVHGENIPGVTENELAEIFRHYDALVKIARGIEKRNKKG